MENRVKKTLKKVVVIVEASPFNSIRTSEAFRMGVGLSLSENQISFLLVGDGVYNLLPLRGEKIGRPSIRDYIDVFQQLDLRLCADADSMAAREISKAPQITRKLPHEEVLQLIVEADVVIPFR